MKVVISEPYYILGSECVDVAVYENDELINFEIVFVG